MRVAINGLAALKPKTGVGHHVAQIAGHLATEFPTDEFTLYPGRRLSRVITRFVHRPAKSGGAGGKPGLKARGFSAAKELAKLTSQAHFTAYTRRYPSDLYHEPNFIPYRSDLPTVVTVHDLSVVRHPEWHPADRVRHHERFFERGLERASHVIVVSDSIRRELAADMRISRDRVSVVSNGVSPAFRPHTAEEITATRRRLNLPESYFLCVGTIEPRKNVDTVLRAFADLPAAAREACPLVLAGPWGWKSERDREAFDRLAGPRGARHLGYVSDADLPAVYAGATALVYPSHYEGFGLPPLEMLACGGAVLVSTTAAIREVVGRHGWFVEPDDLPGWRDAMWAAATDREFTASLRKGGIAHAARFTWRNAARDTHAVYRRVLGLEAMTARRAAA